MQVSTGSLGKHRPQIVVDSGTGTVYAVWEETTGATNSTNLMFGWRDSSTGSWSVPVSIPATAPGWSATTDDFYPHLSLDPSGNLHIVYAEKYQSGSTAQIAAYYVVGSNLTSGPTWSTPVRVNPSGTSLYAVDDARLYVGPDPSGTYSAVGYVLWTGGTSNLVNLTRMGYSGGSVTAIDATQIANPAGVVGGPVAVLSVSATQLQLVYASKNTSNGNAYYSALLTLSGSSVTWQTTPTLLVTNYAIDCAQSGCPGASAVLDSSGATWVVADWDQTTHYVQATSYNGVSAPVVFNASPSSARWPVIVNDATNSRVLALYVQCTYVSSTSCTGSDMWYRTNSGSGWGAPTALYPTTGDQHDVTAQVVGGQLYLAWTGTNQSGTGDQIYFDLIASP